MFYYLYLYYKFTSTPILEKELTADLLGSLIDRGYRYALANTANVADQTAAITLQPLKQKSFAGVQVADQVIYKLTEEPLQMLCSPGHGKILVVMDDDFYKTTADISDNAGFSYDPLFLEQVFNSIKDYAVFTVATSGEINSWNSGAEHIFGYTKNEIFRMHFSELYTAEDRENNVPERAIAAAGREGRVSNEHFFKKKDGSVFWSSCIAFPLYDAGNSHLGFTKVVKNLEEKRSSEKQVLKAQALSESIITTAKEPIVILDESLNIRTASKSFYELFKVNEESAVGRRIYDFVNNLNQESLKHLFENVLARVNICKNYEYQFTSEQGGDKVLILHVSRIKRDPVNPEMYIMFIDDVTEERIISQEKDDFISIATHELKTPLTLIKASAQILEREKEYEHSPVFKKYLAKILEQTDKVLLLAGHLLDVSKIRTGRFTLKKDTFSLCEFLTELVEDFRTMNAEHTIRLEQEGTCLVYADKMKMAQVLSNLLSNAIKYSPDSKEIWVKLSVSDDEREAAISVRDSGIGIPEDEANIIFKRFSRTRIVDERNISGIGLGLYISAEIVKKHGGRIWFESREGIGTTFFLNIPTA